jgi:glycosyltransferase involved in cell wall biosynthesis
VKKELLQDQGLSQPFSIEDVLGVRAYAADRLANYLCNGPEDISVLFVTPGAGLSSSHYRCLLPAKKLSCHVGDGSTAIMVTADCTTELNYLRALFYDVIVLHRQFSAETINVVCRLQRAGKRIVYDFDENVVEFPDGHPRAKEFRPEHREMHFALCHMADRIAVRHVNLLEFAPEFKEKTIVLPDMIDTMDITPRALAGDGPPEGDDVRFLCVTEGYQQADVDVLTWAIGEAIKEHGRRVHFEFVGAIPRKFLVVDQTTKIVQLNPLYSEFISHRPAMSLNDLYQFLSEVDADVALVPLAINDYNEWGSPERIYEMMATGLPVIATRLQPSSTAIDSEWGILVSSPEEWLEAINTVLCLRDIDAVQLMEMGAAAAMQARMELDIQKRCSDWGNRFCEIVVCEEQGDDKI